MILADPALIVPATGSIFACDLNGTVPAQPADPASVRSQWNFVDTTASSWSGKCGVTTGLWDLRESAGRGHRPALYVDRLNPTER